MMYDEYVDRVGEVVTGIIQQSDSRYTLVNLGRVEALLPESEQVHNERYDHGARIKAVIVEVRSSTKGPQVIVSRRSDQLVRELFKLEVPEMADGLVEIKGVAREPGWRSKIAVISHVQGVDPVGACVGPRGSRVRMVVSELRGEKIDIIPFNEEPARYVAKALSPARVREVLVDDDNRQATVIVPDDQLSLSIGREGMNARLAARLTGLAHRHQERVDLRPRGGERRVRRRDRFGRVALRGDAAHRQALPERRRPGDALLCPPRALALRRGRGIARPPADRGGDRGGRHHGGLGAHHGGSRRRRWRHGRRARGGERRGRRSRRNAHDTSPSGGAWAAGSGGRNPSWRASRRWRATGPPCSSATTGRATAGGASTFVGGRSASDVRSHDAHSVGGRGCAVSL